MLGTSLARGLDCSPCGSWQMSWKARLIIVIGAWASTLAVPPIQHYEGTVLSTYRDPVGIITACTGHTGTELKMGQTSAR